MKSGATGKTGVLLVNLGTPDSPSVPHVRKYLREFLLDKRVLDIAAPSRYMLVNGVIAPFRAPKSAKIYAQLWTERGSPLLFHGLDLQRLVQERLGIDYHVAFGMWYQSPSIENALKELREKVVDRIVVLPLFPQYASAGTGSVQEKVMEIVSKWEVIPDIRFISTFCNHPGFISTFAEIAREHMAKRDYDHFVFSYHGLPERQILKAGTKGYCQLGACCNTYHSRNRYCYRAQCFETSRQLAKALNIPEDKYTVSFQSRLGKDPWLQPYTDFILKDLAAAGVKSVLAFSPAFVADCLETTIQVGKEFKDEFEAAGGEHWQLVESCNTHPTWINAVVHMVKEA